MAHKGPLAVLLFVVVLLMDSNWRTGRELKIEHQRRLSAIGEMEAAWLHCQPAVYLPESTNPIDAVPALRYRDNQNGRACVFLKDGRYGNLWWSMVVEGKHQAHVEWQFQEMGKYKW